MADATVATVAAREPRRLPVILTVAAVLIAGAAYGAAGARQSARAAGWPAPSVAEATALSGSWFCAGATAWPGRFASGQLAFENAGAEAVEAEVRLVTQSDAGNAGPARTFAVDVPAGRTVTVPEAMPGLPGKPSDHWVGAIVTVFGGMTSVSQQVKAERGWTAQPCASSAAPEWYLEGGETLRNAWDVVSLLDPYPVDAVVDLSFTTNEGLEVPSAFDGVVVPARGLTVLDLGSALRRREHIAVTVSARAGDVVAFQTEVATAPPNGAPPLGAPGALNPVLPVAGVTLTLGATSAATSWWWPEGGEGPGLTERYEVYNPTARTARLDLVLISGRDAGGISSSTQLGVAPLGWTSITTNGQPWSLPGESYAAHLESLNGVPVVAERSVVAVAPSTDRGLEAALGEFDPGRRWLLAGSPSAAAGELAENWLEVLDPGGQAAEVSLQDVVKGKLTPVAGVSVTVPARGRASLLLSASLGDRPVVVSSSEPIMVQQQVSSPSPAYGTSLSPAVVLAP